MSAHEEYFAAIRERQTAGWYETESQRAALDEWDRMMAAHDAEVREHESHEFCDARLGCVVAAEPEPSECASCLGACGSGRHCCENCEHAESHEFEHRADCHPMGFCTCPEPQGEPSDAQSSPNWFERLKDEANYAETLPRTGTARPHSHRHGVQMTRRAQARETRGFFAIGIYQPKTEGNVGTLMRSAYLYGAAFVFTIGSRYYRTAQDTPNTPANIPLFHFDTMDEAVKFMPHDCPLIGVELDPRAISLPKYAHPPRAAYLLGAEDHGIPEADLDRCESVVQIPTIKPHSMNVAAAGSILLYDRHMKGTKA